MPVYVIIVICAVSAAFALFTVSAALREGARAAAAAALSFPRCAILGFAFAKAFYVLLMETGNIIEWGECDGLFSLQPRTFCFTGGGIGVWLGLLLSAGIAGYRPTGRLTDLFSVPGALLVAGLRMAEIELAGLGTGRFVETEAGMSAPLFTVINQYGEAHVAIFAWEAVWAVIVAAASLTDRNDCPGRRFERAVFRLCAGQILLENMRSEALRWGFVRVEQVLCAAIMTALMLAACRRKTQKRGGVRYLPALGLVVCFAVIVGIEFIRQRSPSRFMGETGGYLMMGFVLVMILVLYRQVTGSPRRPAQNR